MATETIILIVLLIAILLSVTHQYWRGGADGTVPALDLGGAVNTLLYVILVIVLVKVLLGLAPL
jgi:hypothetical protein